MTTIKHRRGTAAQWAASNRVLADGEIGFVRNTTTFKIGNGVTAWNDLQPFVAEPRVVQLINTAIAALEIPDSNFELTFGETEPDVSTPGPFYVQKIG